jgi:hypothetical protein
MRPSNLNLFRKRLRDEDSITKLIIVGLTAIIILCAVAYLS